MLHKKPDLPQKKRFDTGSVCHLLGIVYYILAIALLAVATTSHSR